MARTDLIFNLLGSLTNKNEEERWFTEPASLPKKAREINLEFT